MTSSQSEPDLPLLELALPAYPESVGVARVRLIDLARQQGADADVQQRIALAVSEAVTNAVRHAYDETATSPVVRVRATAARDGGLVVAVSDDGRGLRAATRLPGMGLGLVIMEASAEDFAVDSSDAGTQITLTFGP